MIRKFFPLMFVMVAVVMLSSCDSNKGKVKDLAKQFITAVNGNDKATIFDLYDVAKELKSAKIPSKITDGDITVEKDTSGLYIATIDNPQQQKLVFKIQGMETLKIITSYSVLEFDANATDLAIKTGVPMKQLDDITLSKLLDESGEYITYLRDTYSEVLNGNLTYEEGQWQSRWGGGYYSVTVRQPIRNVGSAPIKASDYNVEFYFYSPNGTASSQQMVQPGVDLAPGEAYTYIVDPGSAYINACRAHDFTWTTTFVYKNQSPIKSLLKYAKFTGNEYSDFQKSKAKAAKAAKTAKKGNGKKTGGVPDDVKKLITDFYNNCVLGINGLDVDIKKYCSGDALSKMREANEYEDGGFNTAIFRTGAQDEKPGSDGKSLVTSIKPGSGEDWYSVSYKDMGFENTTEVKVSGGKIVDVKPNMID